MKKENWPARSIDIEPPLSVEKKEELGRTRLRRGRH